MAYASLVSLQETTHVVLNHPKYSISVDEREIITSIREYVNFLIPFLENLAEKANRFEGKIRDLANEAEDLIEYMMRNRFQMDTRVGLWRGEFEGQLKRVREDIGSITGDMMDDRHCYSPATISSSSAVTTDKNDVVIGLDEDLLAIKGRLCGESSRLEVIPIIGMGGIGNTTLARYAYDDPLIMEYFHIRVFIQVSQDYSAKEFLPNLLASINLFKQEVLGQRESEIAEYVCNEFGVAENDYNESGIAEMSVYKSLKGRRYLIVLDDIWSTNAWDDVRNIFPDDNNGSRIILTTRLLDVAAYASSDSPLHAMKFMDENRSWDLLMRKVFTNGQDFPIELEEIGKMIARGCKGLPLAIVLVAGILSSIDETKGSWEKIQRSVNSVVGGQLDKILSLSYTLLPHHLRPCFLFMAGFPEDHSVSVSRLIKLWVAEGFSKRQNGCKILEEEAEDYLEDLVRRSLVLVTSRKSNGKIKRCSLHDLVRDMCVRKAREEKFLVTGEDILSNGGTGMRHISIDHCRLDEIWGPTTRTILCFTVFSLEGSSLAYLVRFRLLRVLEVMHHHYGNVVVPPQVLELFHLRFLALELINKIPAAISKLVNLQTLVVHTKGVSLASHLPMEIWRMPHLRNLVFTGYYHILPDPACGSTLALKNLHTLSGAAKGSSR